MTEAALPPTLGWQVVSWMQTFLRHGPGDVHGQRWQLDSEQVALILTSYEVDERGRRLYDEAVFSRPKGRAKSELAGGLACAEALGPVRFDHWARAGEVSYWGYEYDEDEPVGRPVTDPFVRCLATEEEQSGNTYDNVTAMLEMASVEFPDLFGGIDLGRSSRTSTRIFLPNGGEVVPSSAGSASKDGGKETFAVFDETHLYRLPELRQMYRTVRRNLQKRKIAQPWSLQTTTMFRRGEDSVAELVFRDHEAGWTPRLHLDHVEGRADVDLHDDEGMKRELRRVYGPFARHMDLDAVLSEARREPDPSDAYRYWLNVARDSSDTWLDEDVWRAGTRPGVRPAAGERIALGFDGSAGTDDPRRWADSTALGGCRLSDGLLFEVGVWEAPGRGAWRPPRSGVTAAVHAAFRRYDVARMYCDPPHWQTEINEWQAEYGRERVVEWWTNRAVAMSKALERLHTDAHEHTLHHDGAERLARHVRHARREVQRSSSPGPDGRRERVLIRKPDDEHKIDGAVAAALAYEARNDAIAAGALEAPVVQDYAQVFSRR